MSVRYKNFSSKIHTFYACIRSRQQERRWWWLGAVVVGFSASVTWHYECQTPITLIRAGICMIKRIRDFNQKNPLVWKCDTLWQARLSPPQPSPHPALQQPALLPQMPGCGPHEYAWVNQEWGRRLKLTLVLSAEEEIKTAFKYTCGVRIFFTHISTKIGSKYFF